MAGEPNRWSQAAIDAAEARIARELAGCSDPAQAEAFLTARVTELSEELKPLASLNRFVYVVHLLRHLLTHPRAGGSDFAALIELGHALLRVEGITPASTLSHLLAELHVLESRRLAATGEVEAASWALLTGERQAQRSKHELSSQRRLLDLARTRLRLGHSAFATAAFAQLERSEDQTLARRAAVWRVRTLRLSGDRTGTHAAVEELRARYASDETTRMLLEWEEAALDAMETGKLEALLRAASKDDPRYTAANLITISLWTKVTRSRAYLDKTVKTRTIRRSFPGEIPRHGSEHAALQALEALESSYDNKIPLEVRLAALGEVLTQRRAVSRIEWEMLLLAAGARSLTRLSQDAMADLFVAEYRALSLALSQGSTGDVLGVLGDLVDRRAA
jgi:hypothetical protein